MADDDNWYVSIDGEQKGPASRAAVERLYLEKRISPRDHVWSEALGDWKEARDVFGQKPPPPPPRAADNAGVLSASDKARIAEEEEYRSDIWTNKTQQTEGFVDRQARSQALLKVVLGVIIGLIFMGFWILSTLGQWLDAKFR